MTLFLGCLLAHLALVSIVASPWLTPNLTLIGMVLTVSRLPQRWSLCAVTAGLVAMAWSVRVPALAFFSYLAAGAICRAASAQWDLHDRRVQSVVTGLAGALLLVTALWLEGIWSVGLLAAGMVQVAVTVLALHVVRRLPQPARGAP